MTTKTSPRSFTSLTLGLALSLAGALAFAACDGDDDGDGGGDTASQADGGDDGCAGDGGDDGATMECQGYTDCVQNMCDDCLDTCSDYISCASGCGCGDDALMCQTDCLNNQSAECSTCFIDQGMCAGQMCSAELMACSGS